jgi:hypothetical protein
VVEVVEDVVVTVNVVVVTSSPTSPHPKKNPATKTETANKETIKMLFLMSWTSYSKDDNILSPACRGINQMIKWQTYA